MEKMIDNKITVLDDISHVLTVPSRYVGSISPLDREEYLFEDEQYKKISIIYIPAILTLFKEVILNSIDENIRTNGKFANKIDITFDDDGVITIKDNGRGLPHQNEETTGLPQSVVAFTQLKSGTNFEDKTTAGGQNGEGVSLVNMFSQMFEVDTSDGIYRTIIKCKNNLSTNTWKLQKCKRKYTIVKFLLDLERFNLNKNFLDPALVYRSLFERTIIDSKMCYPKINFTINKKKITINSFKKYVELYSSNFEIFQYDNLDIAIYSSNDHEHISFVNGINTRRGGIHVDYVVHYIVSGLREKLQKKYKTIKPADIKNRFTFIINVKDMIAPRFDSQTKEELINKSDFNQEFLYDFYNDIENIALKLFKNKELMEPIVDYFKIKEKFKKSQDLKEKEKNLKNIKVAKLIEANSRDRENCVLYIGEGTSAVGSMFINCRESQYQAGYSLRGKFISCQGTPKNKMIANTEVSDICKVVNLKLSDPDISDIRYGKICIMTDADPDGWAIKVTLINFFYTYWPDLIKNGHLYIAESPLIKAKHIETKEIKQFFTLDEFKSENIDDTWQILKYNKGLGSLNNDDYTFTLQNLVKVDEDDWSREMLDMAFDGKFVDKRKQWMLE